MIINAAIFTMGEPSVDPIIFLLISILFNGIYTNAQARKGQNIIFLLKISKLSPVNFSKLKY